MASQNVGSAIGAMAFKAMESFVAEKQRLFDDSVAIRFLPPFLGFIIRRKPLRSALQVLLEKRMPGTYGGMVCRTRYLDDAAMAGVSAGIRSIVIVGAGVDPSTCRAAAAR